MIRKTRIEDAKTVAELYANARQYMIDSGFEQWHDGYPSIDDVLSDIENGVSYLLENENGVYGAFAMIGGTDPTYSYVEGGSWKSDKPYLTLHRVASSGKERGVFSQIVDFAWSKCNHLRVDTHEENKQMQRVIKATGFEYCGIIYLANGEPRLAFELI